MFKSKFTFAELIDLVPDESLRPDGGVPIRMRGFVLRLSGNKLPGHVLLIKSGDEEIRASTLEASYANAVGDLVHTAIVPGDYEHLSRIIAHTSLLGQCLEDAETTRSVSSPDR